MLRVPCLPHSRQPTRARGRDQDDGVTGGRPRQERWADDAQRGRVRRERRV